MPCCSPILTLTLLLFFIDLTIARRTLPNQTYNFTELEFGDVKNLQDTPIDVEYHKGPVLRGNISVHIIWYGTWQTAQKKIIREFINSLSASEQQPSPSIFNWWKTLSMYTNETGNNLPPTIILGQEKNDRLMSQGKTLVRESIESVIKSAIRAKTRPLPIHEHNGGLYLVLTADDVYAEDFCQSTCGYHSFTSTSIVGYTLLYAFVGNSGILCPGMCAYPYAVSDYMIGMEPLKSPNGDVAVDGMIGIIAEQLMDLVTNPFRSGWYVDDNHDHMDMEISDICDSHIGDTLIDEDGATYNMHGIRRRFLVPLVWNYLVLECVGQSAI